MFRRPPRRPPEPPRRPEPEPIRFLDDEPPAPPRPTPPPPPQAPRRREWPITLLTFLAVVGTGLILKGTGVLDRNQVNLEEEVAQSFTVAETPRLVVESYNGPIDIVPGEPGQVECVVVRHVAAENEESARTDLKRIEVTMHRQGNTVLVAVRRPLGGISWNSGASVHVRAPWGSALKLDSSNGPIHVQGIEGPVQARSTNGRIEIKEAVGPLSLTTTNGPIDVEASRAILTAESSNGSIRFRGSLAPGQSTIHTSNGRVRLALPEHQNVRIDARTHNGEIDSDFDFDRAENRNHSKHLLAVLGHDPEATLTVRTSNGKIDIEEDD